jgi:ribulose-phosphate 3-epimerase
MARILVNKGVRARAYLFCRGEDLKGDAALNLAAARNCGVEVVEIADDDTLDQLMPELTRHQLYLDALLGTGLNSPVRGRYARAIELLNDLERPVLAVDVPSGLSADTGVPLGLAVRARWTATFGLVKLGLMLDSGEHVGELFWVDISIPPAVVADLRIDQVLLEDYAAAGADWIGVHAEVCTHLHRTLTRIRELKKRPVVVLNPHTPLHTIEYVLELVDMVLVMSVNPGFGGQNFIPSAVDKVAALKNMIDRQGLKTLIQVDGGITHETIGPVARAGATVFVSGSGVFNHPQGYRTAIENMRRQAQEAGEA